MKLKFLLAILSSLIIFSCKTTEPTVTKSSQKEVTVLSLTSIANATSTFDQATNTYTFTVPTGTNIKALAFTFTLPTGASSVPASGSTQDFTNPVSYVITAEDGSKQTIKVVVVVQAAPKSSLKQILTFSFAELNPIVQGTINNATFEITGEVPATANLKSLKPTITISDKATISPLTGVNQDFTNPVNYIVTAEDGTKQTNVVKITQKAKVNGGEGVYIAGNYWPLNGNKIAMYWRNGEEISLNKNDISASAYSIFVTDNDVYVAGEMDSPNGSQVAAVYWKNGVPVLLTDGRNRAEAKSIFVVGNDIYVAGEEFSSEVYKPKYWKNGKEVSLPLTNEKNVGFATSIFVDGTDVYVAGYEAEDKYNTQYAGLLWVATYWKNGVRVTLSKNGEVDVATSISVYNKDVYVGGHSVDFYAKQKAVYWKNGVKTNLPTVNLDNSKANSLTVNNGNVYICGGSYYDGVYWKNGVLVKLIGDGPGTRTNSISVKGNDIYISGDSWDGGGESPTFWKNGVFTVLTYKNYYHTSSIFVK